MKKFGIVLVALSGAFVLSALATQAPQWQDLPTYSTDHLLLAANMDSKDANPDSNAMPNQSPNPPSTDQNNGQQNDQSMDQSDNDSSIDNNDEDSD